MPENQVSEVAVDANGFYWLLTFGGNLIRWDGYHYEWIQRSSKSRWQRLLHGIDGNIYVTASQNGFDYIDSSSRLRHLKMNGSLAPANPLYNFVTIQLPLQEIKKQNPAPLFSEFKKMFIDDKTKIETDIFNLSKDEFYAVIRIFNQTGYEDRIFFYDHGKIAEIRGCRQLLGNVWMMRKLLLVVNNGFYKVYFKDTLVKAGFDKTLKKIIANSSHGITSSRNGEDAYIFIKDGIYKMSLVNNAVAIHKYLGATAEDKFEDLRWIFYNEKNGRIVATSISGGFSIFEKKHFNVKKISETSAHNVVYTITSRGKELLTNQDFQRKILPGKDDYSFVSPIYLTPGGDIFYPGFPNALLMGHDFTIKKKWHLGSRQVKAPAQIDDDIYLDADTPFVFNTRSLELKKINFSPALHSTEKIWCYGKGPGHLLFAAIDSFLYSVDRNTYRRTKLSSFNVNGIRSLFYDETLKVLFITISGKGIWLLNLRDNKIIEIPTGAITQLLFCHYVLKDRSGDYWLPTNSGLFLMEASLLKSYLSGKSRNLYFPRFGADHGLLNEEFNGGFTNGGILVGDSIFLSSMKGIVSFDPEHLKARLKAGNFGKILVNSVTVDDVLLNDYNPIILSAGFKRCIFNISFPYLNTPSAVLEYRVNGISDTSWIPLSQSQDIILRQLPAGKYHLLVRIKDHPEISSLEFAIIAKPYWYKSTVAYISYIVALLLLFFMVANWRINLIKNKSLKELDKSRRELLAIVSHDLRSPLLTFIGLAESISYLIKRKEYHRIENIAAQIDSTSAKIDLLMNNLLRWHTLEEQKLLIKTESFDLNELVGEFVILYRDIAGFKKKKIEFHSEKPIIITTDKELASLIVRNLLDNAVKNSPPETSIQIFLTTTNEVVLTIQNSILNNARKQVEKVAEIIAQKKNWEPGQEGMGLGLKMVKLAIEKIRGTLVISLEEDLVTTKVSFNES